MNLIEDLEFIFSVPAYLSELSKYERDLDEEQNPSWFRTTYDILTEIDSFVSCVHRQGEGLCSLEEKLTYLIKKITSSE